MTEGTLARWLKKEGDTVKAGDVIAEIETDKATMEVEAVDEGVLGSILVADGTAGREGERADRRAGRGRRGGAGGRRAQPAAPAPPPPAAAAPAARRRRAGAGAVRQRPRCRRRACSPRRWRGAWRSRPASISRR